MGVLRIFELGVAEAAGERGGPGTVGRGDPRGREAAHTTSSGCTRVQQMPYMCRLCAIRDVLRGPQMPSSQPSPSLGWPTLTETPGAAAAN